MGERNQSSGIFLIIHVSHVTMLAIEREAGKSFFFRTISTWKKADSNCEDCKEGTTVQDDGTRG
jgi:glycerol-3-phosphate cytidylyltransferase-like family protein